MTALERVGAEVGDAHAIEELLIEQRRVMGVPSVDVRCRCGTVSQLSDHGVHVAEAAVKAAERELVREGVL